MVKYLSAGACLAMLLLAASLMILAQSSKVPTPICNAPRQNIITLPISLQETQSFNLDDMFSGYNLAFSIPNQPNYLTMREKLTKQKSKNVSQPGLRNFHIGGERNGWGNSLVTISVENNSTIIRWGALDGAQLPDLSNQALVENDTSVSCFDAVWIRAQSILLVDCVQNGNFGLKNYYYYINSTTKATLGKVQNDMYVPFTTIRYRKIRLHYEDNYLYLFRAYFAEDVNQLFRQNTYAEIISLQNPMKPWTVRIMDRSFLHQKKLSITDIDVYLGDLYVLDYFSGLIRFDISKQQSILIVGRYRTDSGFTSFGVYSSNLVNQFLLVMAHNHTILQVDWTDQINPQILTKYTIPDDSLINDLMVNDKYVIVQLTANLTDAKNQSQRYQSSYVFTRGARTYTNAYVAIPHDNPQVFVDLNRDNNQILIIDTKGINIYQVATPYVSFMPTNPQMQRFFNVLIKASSSNEYDPNTTLVCTFTFKYYLVDADLYSIWETGLSLPQSYYANYPGEMFIPLDRYALGANITYGIIYEKSQDPPEYYILQQNSTRITWYGRPDSIYKYTMVVAEQYDSVAETAIFLYTQDATNNTYFSLCGVVPYTDQVHCIENNRAPHISFKIKKLVANRFHVYAGQYAHLVAIVYEQFPSQVFVYDAQDSASLQLPPIMFPQGYEGKVENIEFLGNYLVVVLKYVKQIIFYDLARCRDYYPNPCNQIYRINSTTMTNIGVNYFSPIDIFASQFHPYVLFVQCLDRVVILDITRQGPILLKEFTSPATKEPGVYKWKMAIARGQIILINPPNIIEEHDLDQLYISGDVPFNRKYPTYGYVIPDNFQVDFSDSGNLVYISGIDKALPQGQNTVVMVYRSGYPSVSSFYDVFHFNAKYDDFLLEVTGNFGDYVTCVFGNKIMMFRQYEIPILVFKDVFGNFTFNLTYTNDPNNRFYYSAQSTVYTANYPEDIIINNTELNKTDYLTKKVNDTDTSTFTNIDDSTWFNGSIINYTLDGEKCLECNKKIKVINHIEEERVLLGALHMSDYTFARDGGYIQQYQSIIKMKHNGSIDQFVNFPSAIDGESCMLVQHSWIYDYTLSACKNQQRDKVEVLLYLTVYSASKPFVNGPYPSSAKHVTSMHVMEQLMIIVDVDESPFSFDREGGIIIYAMNHDPFEPEVFDELEFIDSTDLSAANGWDGSPCFIGNANFAFTNITGTYRLVISQLRNGFFVVDFKWTKGRKSVQILKIEYINLAEELYKIHLPMPNLAFFTAVAINKQYYDEKFNYWQSEVIIATSNFHSFQINLHIDRTGTIVTHEIAKIFYRYGFYQTQNYIKAFDGYFAIAQRLPTILHVFDWYSKLVLSVYDTKDRWVWNEQTGKNQLQTRYLQGTNIPVTFMLGGYAMQDGRTTFDWNFTFTRNSSDPFTRLGLLALNDQSFRIWQLSVHQKLIIYSYPGIKQTQQGFLVARNDYHKIKIPLKLVVDQINPVPPPPPPPPDTDGGFPGWAIAIIVIGSLAAAAGIGFVVYNKFIKAKAPNRESETERSLLEREGMQDDKDQDDDDDEDQQEEGQQEEEEANDQKLAPKVEAVSRNANESEARPPAAIDISINRETITTENEGQKPELQAQPKGE